MTNEEKAREIAENSKQYFYHDEYERGFACALRMAKWKDEQFEQEKEELFDRARKFLISHGRGQLCRQFENFVRQP